MSELYSGNSFTESCSVDYMHHDTITEVTRPYGTQSSNIAVSTISFDEDYYGDDATVYVDVDTINRAFENSDLELNLESREAVEVTPKGAALLSLIDSVLPNTEGKNDLSNIDFDKFWDAFESSLADIGYKIVEDDMMSVDDIIRSVYDDDRLGRMLNWAVKYTMNNNIYASIDAAKFMCDVVPYLSNPTLWTLENDILAARASGSLVAAQDWEMVLSEVQDEIIDRDIKTEE